MMTILEMFTEALVNTQAVRHSYKGSLLNSDDIIPSTKFEHPSDEVIMVGVHNRV